MRDQYRAKQKGDYGAKNQDEKDNSDFIHDQRANVQMHIARQDQVLERVLNACKCHLLFCKAKTEN